jgi:hypothetical protein
VCEPNHCPDLNCPGHARTRSPDLEITVALPKWAIGWDVLCWIGQRRCARHRSVSQIQSDLWDDYRIDLSADSITRYILHYQVMLAARQQDPEELRQHYQGVDEVTLSIDGLQREKGHEALYVVRELKGRRVWFAVPLISAAAEVRRLIAQAKASAEPLGKPVALWLSDRQDAFVTGIAAEFPGVPHRCCDNYFLRAVAKPVLEADSHANVQMREKVRGLRTIEQAVLKRQDAQPSGRPVDDLSGATGTETPKDPTSSQVDAAGAVVLDYCTAVGGILNDDQGGPLNPPGLRMAGALDEVRAPIRRNLDAKGGIRRAATGPTRRVH